MQCVCTMYYDNMWIINRSCVPWCLYFAIFITGVRVQIERQQWQQQVTADTLVKSPLTLTERTPARRVSCQTCDYDLNYQNSALAFNSGVQSVYIILKSTPYTPWIAKVAIGLHSNDCTNYRACLVERIGKSQRAEVIFWEEARRIGEESQVNASKD